MSMLFKVRSKIITLITIITTIIIIIIHFNYFSGGHAQAIFNIRTRFRKAVTKMAVAGQGKPTVYVLYCRDLQLQRKCPASHLAPE